MTDMSDCSLVSTVYEYQILYSSRVTQKDKRWCDGKLKYYELNNKLEIYNEQGTLITTDFFEKANTESILLKNLQVENQFELANNRFVIQIVDSLGVFQRDISNYVRTRKVTCKRQRIDSSDTLNRIELKSLAIKSRIVKMSNPGTKRRVLLDHQPSRKADSTIVKNRFKTSQYDSSSNKPLMGEFLCRKHIRIPAKSSSYFKYLRKETNQLSIIADKTGYMSRSFVAKQLNNCQNKGNKTHEIEEPYLGPLGLDKLENLLPKCLTPSRNYNTSVSESSILIARDFDLSESSDFDDIDL
ncbi:uncharacterized protein PRCAT00001653001 [Priceomyces carsonii]|uniref:uncharacterized protein n=1 Tax=Priceomyces carsonii TaxID=28549 RepID=UPI002EDAA392|nr:unnamed protein product [Priceomyces carsonii]